MEKLITAILNRHIPKCAVGWYPDDKGIKYLHPRKGWKFVSWKRLSIIPHGA